MPSCALSTRHREPFSQLQFLQVIYAEAEVLRLAVYTRNSVRYGRAEGVMTASLSNRTQQVLAVNFSELDAELVRAVEGNKLSGLFYNSISGMA